MNVIDIELKKLRWSRSFWAILGIYFILLGIINLIVLLTNRGSISTDFRFPEIWKMMAFIVHYLNLIMGLIAVTMVTTDYRQHTLRQHIIDGMSRTTYYLGKLGTAVIISFLLSTIDFLIIWGTGMTIDRGTLSVGWDIAFAAWAGTFASLLGYMSFALMVSFVVREQVIAILIFLGYFIIFELLVELILRETSPQVRSYLPGNILGYLAPPPRVVVASRNLTNNRLGDILLGTRYAIAILYILIFNGIGIALLQRRDIK